MLIFSTDADTAGKEQTKQLPILHIQRAVIQIMQIQLCGVYAR